MSMLVLRSCMADVRSWWTTAYTWVRRRSGNWIWTAERWSVYAPRSRDDRRRRYCVSFSLRFCRASTPASINSALWVPPPLSISLSLSISLKSISKAQFCSKWSFYELSINSYRQWCRSVVKMSGVRFSQASRQTDSDYTLRQWFPNTQQSRFLAACRAPRKISFTSHFWHKSFILDDVKLAKLSNNSFWMKECDILRDHKFITLWPLPTYFQGDKTPSPWDLRPCLPS